MTKEAEHNPDFVKGVLQSVNRARRLREVLRAGEAPSVSLSREDVEEIVSMHLLLAGYVLGVEGERDTRAVRGVFAS